ncbi:Insertion element 4 transposase N-terminal [Micromonospora rhizosphaerae]|uniref:Insertion element 4 transposase N-terminal n=1 Tax=Micromonospora rhizosphaerae TaxID=568872 RepID=A0A1C6TD98_9ACTN|nr:transposase domain-containing protein [Micromonospora rhizosphaerae]SCL39425.1 Insertion element 4 transposase N-terminal [Micromonospora rhizosphaerae]
MLRAAVIAGPAGFGVLDEQVTGRLWSVVADSEVIGRALAAAGYADARRRVLTAAVTTLIVLGLCLLRRVTATLSRPDPADMRRGRGPRSIE